jgi:uncharacterized protein YprB with RNaseH-like and TPR domain
MSQKAKVLILDIECTNLSSNFGYVLCVGYKKLDDPKTHIISITDYPEFSKNPTNDYYVIRDAAKVLSEADMWVGHYSSRFDIPYIQSRLLYHNLPLLPNVQHVDTWRIARYKMKLNSNRLASITGFFGFEEKTPLTGPIWVRAAAGHKPSIKYVEGHCKQDVIVLEQVYKKIRPLCSTHPSVALMDGEAFGCPNCGNTKVQKRGTYLSRLHRFQRFYCPKCGTWSRGRKSQESTELR